MIAMPVHLPSRLAPILGLFVTLGSLFPPCSLQAQPAYPPVDDTLGWFAFQPEAAGGLDVIDMHAWLDAPAGKHGVLRMQGADFEFENGTPIKFWGVNISSRNAYVSAEKARSWAHFLARYGVNAVRFHKFSWHGPSDDRSTVIDSARFARFDAFNHILREKGIYYGWSHIYGHKVREADRDRLLAYDEIKGLEYPWSHLNGSTSGLVNFAPDLQALNIELTVNMLHHRNPHTGLRYADDPALAFIELQNEDNIFWSAIGRSLEQAPTYRALLCEQFSAWLLDQYGSEAAWRRAWGEAHVPEGQHLAKRNVFPAPNHERFSAAYAQAEAEGQPIPRHEADKLAFLYSRQIDFYDRFVEAIRATGYRGLIVGSCWQAGSGPSHYYNLHADYRAGVIDRHNYFGGGTGHRMVPGKVNDQAMVEKPGSGLLSTGLQQVVDRPFSLSEWMSLLPNRWIAEASPLITLYGMGLQGWDASFHFGSDHPHFTETLHTPGVYNVASPTQLGLYPALARMLYRHDLQEGGIVSVRHVHLPSFGQKPLGFSEMVKQEWDQKVLLGGAASPEMLAVGRTVVHFSHVWLPSITPSLEGFVDREGRVLRSNTGQLEWHYGNHPHVRLNAQAAKGVVGFTDGKRIDLGKWSVALENSFAVALLVPLHKAETDSLLLVTMAQARNTGMQYSEDGKALTDAGRAPILLEPVSLTLYPNEENASYVLHPLTHGGKLGETSLAFKQGNPIVVEGKVHQTMYYLLTRNK